MDVKNAAKAVSALAHAHRIEAFRILVREAPSGLSAGEIASRIGVSPSALSFHLAQLERANLVLSKRDGRNSIYAVKIDGMRELLTFLTEDCCNGHPEICGVFAVNDGPGASSGAITDGQE